MKKIISMVLILCMMCAVAPFAGASGNIDDSSMMPIQSYDDLIAWKNAGYPEIFGFFPSEDFGWPTEETVVDLTGADTLYMGNATWTIPENITIKNFTISLTDNATLNINGKWNNSLTAVSGGIPVINVTNSTLNLAKDTEVYGSVYLYDEGTLNANDAYVENIKTYDSSGSTVNHANISGTVTTDLLNFSANMTLNILDGSEVTVARMAGVSTGVLTIKDGAKFYCAGKGSADLVMSINIESGGEFSWLFTHMTPQNTVTIKEGGVLNSYFGIITRKDYEGGEFRGNGTINLYSAAYGFRYDNGKTEEEYWENPNVEAPGTVPCLDATIKINKSECDHAGDKAYKMLTYPKRSDDEPDRHYLQCSGCEKEIDDSLELCSYKLVSQDTTASRYGCECGNEYIVQRLTGTCGEDISFALEEGTLSLEGSGTTNEFSAENAPWAEKSEEIKTVELGKEITGIGADAFADCTSLENVEYDGTYEDWKNIDVKEGNDALLYAEISFSDGSVLLAPTDSYCGKADLLYKTEESEKTEFTLSIITDAENAGKLTEEQLKESKVFVAVYDGSGKMTELNAVTVTVADGTGRAECKAELPQNEIFKLFMWGENSDPMTANIDGSIS